MKMRVGAFKITGNCLLLAVTLLIGTVCGIVLDRQVVATFVPLDNIPAAAEANFRLMAEAWNTIERSYTDRSAVKPVNLTYGAISGMVEALGDTGHSTFLTPDMVQSLEEFGHDHFKGIGAEVQMKEGHVVIVAPLDDSPAQKAGLHPGDIILKVDDQDIVNLSLEKVVAKIKGKEGTPVTLTILNPTAGHTRDVTIVRASIAIHNATWQRLPGTSAAHLRISAFSQGVAEDLKKALAEIEQANLDGIVLDLRNNSGGLLDEAIATASQFLNSGLVLQEKTAGKVTPVPVRAGGTATGIPMVVLVNKGTASGAEIVAGALQDAGRVKLVGETTFGTGTVLREFLLSDGSALLLAIEEWLTPKGHTIWHKGITPDVTVVLPPEVEPLYPRAVRGMTAAQLEASKDEQLKRALELLPPPMRVQAFLSP
jgi:carboxyl-terminal processing protease